jgi:transposase InsO family protein
MHYNTDVLCDVLGVSRSGYYDWKLRKPSKRELANQQLLDKIRALHKTHRKRYGSPRMHAALVKDGERVSLGRVERLMRQHHIVAQRAKRHMRVYVQREQQKAPPNVLSRDFYAAAPDSKWVSDITFIPTREGHLHLAIVLDIFSRAVIGWAMSRRINGDLVLEALDMAITHRGSPKGVMVHSDQGSQYTAEAYRKKLNRNDMVCSMSRKGECHDNAVAESFFHTLKEELVHDKSYATRRQAKHSIFKYIELYYNRQRLHSYLGYEAPMVYERMHAA